MARANAKLADAPTIAVKLEKGTLVPASAYDRELLDQWHNGTVLNIVAIRAKVPPLERKYFAMLGELLKVAETDWTNVPAAHEYLKKVTGFVTPIHMETGEWGSRSRHIASFSDGELSEYYELVCGIIQHRYGIDPETLQREAPNTDIADHQARIPNADADDGPGDETIPPVVGGPIPDVDTASGDPEAGGEIETPRKSPPANGIQQLNDEDMFWLKQTARMLLAASGSEDILNNQRRLIKEYWTPVGISTQARAIGAQIYRLCKAGKPSKIEIATLAGCRMDDLRPEAR